MPFKLAQRTALACFAAVALASPAAQAVVAQTSLPGCDTSGNVVSGCQGCLSSCIVQDSWVYGAGAITNASAGDALYHRGPGIVSMADIGYIWSHVGVMLGTTTVVNTDTIMTGLTNAIVKPVGFWNGIGTAISMLLGGGYGVVSIDPATLYNLQPGMSSVFADSWPGFGFSNLAGTVDWHGDTALQKPATTNLRADANRVATWMQNNYRPYRIHTFYLRAAAEASGGNSCSNALATGTQKGGMLYSTPIADTPTPSVDLGHSILSIQASLWYDVRWKIVSPTAPGLIGTGDRDSMASGIVDQVLNCFLTLQPGGCSIFGGYYLSRAHTNVGDGLGGGAPAWPAGSAVAPDYIGLSGPLNSLSCDRKGGATCVSAAPTRYAGKNAGPWNGAPLVATSYSGGGWVSNRSGYCPSPIPAGQATSCPLPSSCNYNGVCDALETSTSCSSDCLSTCGDGVCQSTELQAGHTCPRDCA